MLVSLLNGFLVPINMSIHTRGLSVTEEQYPTQAYDDCARQVGLAGGAPKGKCAGGGMEFNCILNWMATDNSSKHYILKLVFGITIQ